VDAATITAYSISGVAVITTVGAYLTGARTARIAAATAHAKLEADAKAAAEAKAASLVALQIEAENKLAIARVEANAELSVAETTGRHDRQAAEAPGLAGIVERMEREQIKERRACRQEIKHLRDKLDQIETQHAEDMKNAVSEFQALREEEREADRKMIAAMIKDLTDENARLATRNATLERRNAELESTASAIRSRSR
jgi:hypothetical protein